MTDKMDEAAKAALAAALAAADRRRALLAEYDLVSEEDLAVLLNVTVKTLRNRPAEKLPEKVHALGFRGTAYRRPSVLKFLQSKPGRRRKRTADASAVGASVFGDGGGEALEEVLRVEKDGA